MVVTLGGEAGTETETSAIFQVLVSSSELCENVRAGLADLVCEPENMNTYIFPLLYKL